MPVDLQMMIAQIAMPKQPGSVDRRDWECAQLSGKERKSSAPACQTDAMKFMRFVSLNGLSVVALVLSTLLVSASRRQPSRVR